MEGCLSESEINACRHFTGKEVALGAQVNIQEPEKTWLRISISKVLHHGVYPTLAVMNASSTERHRDIPSRLAAVPLARTDSEISD
jgi:hypothetical protein